MAAPKGNEYYLLRNTHGRSKIFANSEEFGNACNEYFKWCVDNPLQEQSLFAFQGNITKAESNKMRVFSREGLCNFIDISIDCLRLYEKREDFINVTTRVQQIIDAQQFEGATANLLNPNIIARKLGLTDKIQTEHSGEIKSTPSAINVRIIESNDED